jgi:elongation factor Ts
MQCKRALEEAGGDVEKAKVILRKQSASIATKKSDRALGAGVAAAYTHAGGAVVGAVVLACETDFVSKNEEFSKLAYGIAMHVAATNPQFITRTEVNEESLAAARSVFKDEAKDKPEAMRAKIVEGKINAYLKEQILMDQPFIKNPELTIGQLVEGAMQKFGEKTAVTRMARFAVTK